MFAGLHVDYESAGLGSWLRDSVGQFHEHLLWDPVATQGVFFSQQIIKAQYSESNSTNLIQASACDTFTDSLLAPAGHIAEPKVKRGEVALPAMKP